MSSIAEDERIGKVDSFDQCDEGEDFEREHDGSEPECVRDILTQPVDEIGPTFRAAYERMLESYPVESECAEIARFGKWARGKKGKPLCLYVAALVFGLQRNSDREAKLSGANTNGEHVPFACGGLWVATMFRNYGIRPDMTHGTMVRKVYEVLAAYQDAGILKLTREYRYAERIAREFTAHTVSELDAVPAPAVEPKPETPVAEVVAEVWREASADEGNDNEGRFACAVAALEAHAKHERHDSARRREFRRVIDEFRGYLFRERRARWKAADALRCRPSARKRKGEALARCET